MFRAGIDEVQENNIMKKTENTRKKTKYRHIMDALSETDIIRCKAVESC